MTPSLRVLNLNQVVYILERMHRGDVSGTHRTVFFGELGNTGMVEGSKSREDWQKFWAERRELIEKVVLAILEE